MSEARDQIRRLGRCLELLIIQRECKDEQLTRIRTYAKTLRDTPGDSDFDRSRRVVGEVLENILDN